MFFVDLRVKIMYFCVVFVYQDLQIFEEVDVIVLEWMGYMFFYEVIMIMFSGFDRQGFEMN